MTARSMSQWRRGILASRKRAAMPIMTHPGIELLDSTIQKALNESAVHCEVVRILAERFPSAGATMMMDLSVEAEAFGAPVTFFDRETPAITQTIASDLKSIEALALPPLSAGRVPRFIDAASLVSSAVTDRPVFSCCIGHFSLASRLYGLAQIMTSVLVEPAAIHRLIEKTTTFLHSYARELKKTGLNGLIMAEPSSGLLSEDLCREFSSSYIRRIVQTVQDDSFMIILHNCGETNHLLTTMQETGAGGLHFGNKCDIVRALGIVDRERIVFGNLDPVELFRLGSPLQIEEATFDLLKRTSPYSNFVVSSGCDIPPGVPLENVVSFFETVEKFNSSK